MSDTSALARQSERQPCPRCNRSRKFFCYTCLLPLPGLQSALPRSWSHSSTDPHEISLLYIVVCRVSLPVKVEIVKHPGEVDGKSTAVHAAILAPDWVSLHTHPVLHTSTVWCGTLRTLQEIPDYRQESGTTALVFPGPNRCLHLQWTAAVSFIVAAQLQSGGLGGSLPLHEAGVHRQHLAPVPRHPAGTAEHSYSIVTVCRTPGWRGCRR